jgi:hypothetical protein
MKRLLTLVLSTTILVISAYSSLALAPVARVAGVPVVDAKEITVYVTRTGTKYHRGSCRYLSQSKIPMPLSEAKRSYDPCSVCKPPK